MDVEFYIRNEMNIKSTRAISPFATELKKFNLMTFYCGLLLSVKHREGLGRLSSLYG